LAESNSTNKILDTGQTLSNSPIYQISLLSHLWPVADEDSLMIRFFLSLGMILFVLLSGSVKPTSSAESPACSYDLVVAELLAASDPSQWLDWIEKLSGAEPVQVNGLNTFIQTRETRMMFSDQPHARGYDYVFEQVSNWYLQAYVLEHEYDIFDLTAKNLVVTIPGIDHPDEVVLLSAHLDSAGLSSILAPGANDNGTGSATLLEAARLLRRYRFDRTIQLVWFTGEEDGLTGSGAFVRDHPEVNFTGVINMDMFGWDGDGDRCFDIHTDSEQPASALLGACVAEVIAAYDLDLKHEFTDMGRSDQLSFQRSGIAAIGIHENVIDNRADASCSGTDMNTHLHSINDTVDQNLTPAYGFAIAQAGLAAVMELAEPLSPCFTEGLQLTVVAEPPQTVQLQWNAIPGTSAYRVYRSSYGCQGSWQVVGETSKSAWQDPAAIEGWPYQYQVEALGGQGVCVSTASNCVMVGPPPPPVYELVYLPIIH
jgi:leucyl aminopeptidase